MTEENTATLLNDIPVKVDISSNQENIKESSTVNGIGSNLSETTSELNGEKEVAQDVEIKEEEIDPFRGAPEEYNFDKVGEIEIDKEISTAFAEIASALDLSQEGASKILEKILPVMQERQTEYIRSLHADWVVDSKKDKEIGGLLLEDSVKTAKIALKKIGTPKLNELLEQSGLGNHPEIIRFLSRVGKQISEDSFVSNSGFSVNQAKKPKEFSDFAKALYR